MPLANVALQLHINLSLNRPPDCTWRRPPGRPWNKWLDQLPNDSTRPTGDLWRRAVDRGHDIVVQRRDRPRWLREHDDDDDEMAMERAGKDTAAHISHSIHQM